VEGSARDGLRGLRDAYLAAPVFDDARGARHHTATCDAATAMYVALRELRMSHAVVADDVDATFAAKLGDLELLQVNRPARGTAAREAFKARRAVLRAALLQLDDAKVALRTVQRCLDRGFGIAEGAIDTMRASHCQTTALGRLHFLVKQHAAGDSGTVDDIAFDGTLATLMDAAACFGGGDGGDASAAAFPLNASPPMQQHASPSGLLLPGQATPYAVFRRSAALFDEC
jgi:hypothetical protein